MLRVIGSIVVQEDPMIPLATWREVIEAFKLRPIESCDVINPFTQEPMTLNTPLELAALVINEERVGVVRWCSRGGGLDVFGDPGVMTGLAEAIAARIGGEVNPV